MGASGPRRQIGGIRHMEREITPDEIRASDLGRSFRGYNRKQTEQLLADVAEAHAEVIAQRDALAQQVEALRSDRSARETQAKHEAGELSSRVEESQRRAAELEGELERLRETHARESGESQRLRDEFAEAQTALEKQRSETAGQEELVARLRTRAKALSEQLAMLESDARAESADAATQTTTLEERALLALARVERAAERIERDAREHVDTILTEAHDRADEIVRAAHDSPETKSVDPADSSVAHDNSATDVGDAGEPRHRPEFDLAPIPDFPTGLRARPEGPSEEPEERGAEEAAGLRFSDYRDPRN
jgi:hypothetical protein